MGIIRVNRLDETCRFIYLTCALVRATSIPWGEISVPTQTKRQLFLGDLVAQGVLVPRLHHPGEETPPSPSRTTDAGDNKSKKVTSKINSDENLSSFSLGRVFT
jgi:hypothetical protein